MTKQIIALALVAAFGVAHAADVKPAVEAAKSAATAAVEKKVEAAKPAVAAAVEKKVEAVAKPAAPAPEVKTAAPEAAKPAVEPKKKGKKHHAKKAEKQKAFQGYFEKAKAAGKLPAEADPELLTQAISCYMKGIVFEYLDSPGSFEMPKKAPKLVDLFFHNLITTMRSNV